MNVQWHTNFHIEIKVSKSSNNNKNGHMIRYAKWNLFSCLFDSFSLLLLLLLLYDFKSFKSLRTGFCLHATDVIKHMTSGTKKMIMWLFPRLTKQHSLFTATKKKLIYETIFWIIYQLLLLILLIVNLLSM